jgi:hypothetical protein
MPAVDPTRLRFQIEDLMAFFQSPQKFHHQLQDMFGFYANRTLRYGDATTHRPLIPIYDLPRPVLQQLEIDLKRHVTTAPEAALTLADELWKDGYLEIKLTAIDILGLVPVDDPEPILLRIESWLSPDLDQVLISRIFSMGTLKLQEAYFESWEGFLEHLLNHEDPKWTALGIRGLSEVINIPEFKNLPAIFRLISPFIHNPQRSYFQNLEILIRSMVQRSPTETAFFIKQALAVSSSPQTAQLVKQCLPLFTEDIMID